MESFPCLGGVRQTERSYNMPFAVVSNDIEIWLGFAEASWLNEVDLVRFDINVVKVHHLFFLLRSPNLGKTMLDFRPRLFTILPFFDLVDFDVWSTSMAAGAVN